MLQRLSDAGIVIVPGVSVDTSAFTCWCERMGLRELIDTQLARVRVTPIETGAALARIRAAIQATDLDDAIATPLRLAITPLLVRGPVAVRSSAVDEDGASASHAGVYHSELDVASLEGVYAAVRSCWLSLFSESAAFYRRGHFDLRMGVIVQPMVTGDQAGVLFTRDPLDAYAPGMVAVVAPRSNSGVTDGSFTAPTRRIDRTMPRSDLDRALAAVAPTIEAVIGAGADIEWSFNAGTLIVHQARPITAPPASLEPPPRIVEQEDLDAVYGLPLGACTRLFMRQLLKKVWYRRACQEQGIGTYRIFYVWASAGEAADAAVTLGRRLRTPFVRVDWGTGSMAVRHADLAAAIATGVAANGVDAQRGTVQVSELIPADATGFSAPLADGGVVVEAFPPGLLTMKGGAHQSSTYRFNGQSMRASIATFSRRGVFDPSAPYRWREEPAEPFRMRVGKAQLQQIKFATDRLAATFGEVRLEWYLWDGSFFLKDLTLESSAISGGENGEEVRVLSPGMATGTVVRVARIADLDAFARANEISVVRHGATNPGDNVVAFSDIRRRAQAGEALIVLAEYPSIGLIPIVEHVKAFVFARGNLLCHTAIVLRERRVPGIVAPAAALALAEGERVQVTPAGVSPAGLSRS
jgi:pyruvate,water dikinase